MLSYTINEIGQSAVDEDLKLVRRSQRGDLRAFETLVERHQKKMINLAFRMTGDYEEACDLAQEAFLSAYRAIKKFRGDSRFSSWLYTIVLNKTRNWLRHLQGRGHLQTIPLDPIGDPERGNPAVDPPADEPSVLERMEKKEIENRVQECIGRLEPEFREPLVLRDILGHSYEEVAASLGLADGTVKSRLFRARASMKDCLKSLWGGL